MPETILSVQQLTKKYILGRERSDSLAYDLLLWGKQLLRRSRRQQGEEFYALRDLSFELERGDILGIIGRNGAGKSTLLKILAEVTAPSSGRIEFNGTVTSILDIGTGFHPDLTGRQNTYLSAALAGIDKKTIREKFDEIHAFSGIGDYIDQPVKHYSSGMYLRLAFSVAFHSEMDILLLDEVLSVGDVDFRHRSTKRIQEIADRGTTILLVSHELPAIRLICNKCLFLHKGQAVSFGKTHDVVEEYLRAFYEKVTQQYDQQDDSQLIEVELDKPELRFESIEVQALGKSPEDPIYMSDDIEIKVQYTRKQAEGVIQLVMSVTQFSSPVLFDCMAYREGFDWTPESPGTYALRTVIPGNWLHTGVFFVNLMFASTKASLLNMPYAKSFQVEISPWEKDATWNTEVPNLPLRPALEWTKTQLPDSGEIEA